MTMGATPLTIVTHVPSCMLHWTDGDEEGKLARGRMAGHKCCANIIDAVIKDLTQNRLVNFKRLI